VNQGHSIPRSMPSSSKKNSLIRAQVTANLNVDDLVANERLQEDADKSHETILHVTIFDGFTRRDAV